MCVLLLLTTNNTCCKDLPLRHKGTLNDIFGASSMAASVHLCTMCNTPYPYGLHDKNSTLFAPLAAVTINLLIAAPGQKMARPSPAQTQVVEMRFGSETCANNDPPKSWPLPNLLPSQGFAPKWPGRGRIISKTRHRIPTRGIVSELFFLFGWQAQSPQLTPYNRNHGVILLRSCSRCHLKNN